MNNPIVIPLPEGFVFTNREFLRVSDEIEIPVLHSRPEATKKLCLAMNGYFNPSWRFYTNITTPPFLGDPVEVWARVSEDYAPFNIDVTTEVYPVEDGKVAVIAIGGNYTDWYGSPAGGVAFVGGFYNSAPGVGYVFANNLSNYPKYVAEAVSHEAGHAFGLSHQALWNGNTLVSAYNQGDGFYAPIMGVGYYAPRTIWFKGPTDASPASIQDDIKVLTNNLGLVPDESAPVLIEDGIIDIHGLINNASDEDTNSFFTPGGELHAKIEADSVGENLDPTLDLLDSSNNVIASGVELSVTLSAGQYYLKARGNGVYGDQGRYKISGTLVSYNNVVIRNGDSLLLNVTGYDKKGNLSQIQNVEWFGGSPIVDLQLSNNGTLCKVLTKPSVYGSVVLVCTANGKSDSIELVVNP